MPEKKKTTQPQATKPDPEPEPEQKINLTDEDKKRKAALQAERLIGICYPDDEKQLAKIADDTFKFKGVLEWVDGFLFHAIIVIVDNVVVDRILAESIRAKFNAILQAALAGDKDTVVLIGTDLINSVVNLPVLDEEAERRMIKGLLEFIVGMLIKKADTVAAGIK